MCLSKNKKYIFNSAWMLAEYGVKVFSSIFVTIYMARYLGPEDFGVLSYATSIILIVMCLARLGMDNILIREIINNPESRSGLISTSFYMILISSVLFFSALSFIVYFFESDRKVSVVLFLASTAVLFQCFSVFDYDFQSRLKAKYSSFSKSIAIMISSVVKIFLVMLDADIYFFAAAYALDYILIALFLFFAYFLNGQKGFIRGWDVKLVLPMLRSSLPIVISVLASTLYMKVDQIMIKSMLGNQSLGLYAAAIKIYDGWLMIIYVLSVSLYPMILKSKKLGRDSYESNLVFLCATLFWSSMLFSFLVFLFSSEIISFTYGTSYSGSSQVLIIVMFASVFSALSSASSRYLSAEKMEYKIVKRTGLALIINVSLNYFFIPIYGINGAAVTTLFTMFVSVILVNYFDKDLLFLRRVCESAVFPFFIFKKIKVFK